MKFAFIDAEKAPTRSTRSARCSVSRAAATTRGRCGPLLLEPPKMPASSWRSSGATPSGEAATAARASTAICARRAGASARSASSGSCARRHLGRGDAAVPRDHRLEARRPDRAERPRAQLHRRGSEQGLGHRRDVHLDARGLAVPGRDPRPVLASRRRLGDGPNNDRRLALDALERAVASGTRWRDWCTIPIAAAPTPAPTTAMRSQLRRIASMSRKGDCWDNAVAESFFATLKAEMVDHEDFQTARTPRLPSATTSTASTTSERRHSSIGYLSPIEFELRLSANQEAA